MTYKIPDYTNEETLRDIYGRISGTDLISTVILQIGAWDMTNSATLTINVSDYNINSKRILNILTSFSDDNEEVFFYNNLSPSIDRTTSTITLTRENTFNSTDYNSTDINRGEIILCLKN